MPARVVVVLDEPALGEKVVENLLERGCNSIAIPDPMVALDALEQASQIELLVASVNFPSAKPNGVSLALLARSRRPDMKVIFIGSPDYTLFAAGLGEIISTASASDIVRRVVDLLAG